MNIELFKPVVELSHLDKIEGLRYLAGTPMDYRFNASDGSFQITMGKFQGKEFSLIPIAYTLGRPDLYGPDYEGKEWLDLYFINKKGGVGCISFHGYSVDNFKDKVLANTFYMDIDHPVYIKLIATPEKKETKQKEGSKEEGKSYYIVDWSFEVIEPEFAESLQTLADNAQNIYRQKTAIEWAMTSSVMSIGYVLPDEIKMLADASQDANDDHAF